MPTRAEWAKGKRPVNLMNQRYVNIDDLVALIMVSRINEDVPYGRPCVSFRLMQVRFNVDESGRIIAGGSPEHIVSECDFALQPLQVSQMYDPMYQPGHEFQLTARVGGRFQMIFSEQWVDFCVGKLRGSNVPQVLYRVLRSDFDFGKVTPQVADGTPVLAKTVLATGRSPASVGVARFHNNVAELCKMPNERLFCRPIGPDEKNLDNIFAAANIMNRMCNDMVLDQSSNAPPILPIDSWAPYGFLEIPVNELQEIWHAPNYQHSQALRAAAIKAVGPDGDFYVTSDHAGKLTEISTSERRPHLIQLRIGSKLQSIPASSLMLEGIEPGVELSIGQPIADACPRLYYTTWESLTEKMDTNTDGSASTQSNAEWWLLRRVFNRLVRRADSDAAWLGNGCLLEQRLLPQEVIKPEWNRYLDIGSLRDQFAEPSINAIVCPPFYEDGESNEFTINGITFSWANRQELAPEPVIAEPLVRQAA
jgi:hypothetical protein